MPISSAELDAKVAAFLELHSNSVVHLTGSDLVLLFQIISNIHSSISSVALAILEQRVEPRSSIKTLRQAVADLESVTSVSMVLQSAIIDRTEGRLVER